ncbi:hypothetical protein FGO68_gene16987 [Halteria grandinella]|uniref:Major facilitator superfamily (MFS) profile domain-containing protein n=1 Tax=Halteria grandinella TaxID=5974 RepID=A0A8J8T344_HALGN|nr:hypothetical protein FGO68_gene16987 [Halteria grandinella]
MVDRIVLVLGIITLLTFINFSFITHFYQKEAYRRRINAGFLAGIQALTFLFSSLISGQYLHKIGRHKSMLIGAVLIIISMMGFGSLYFVSENNKAAFILLSIIWKFLFGIGAGLNLTASYAIIVAHFKDDWERNIGMMKAFIGIGPLIGLFFGGLMHQIGGYILPYFASTCVYFLMYPMIAVTLNKIYQIENNQELERNELPQAIMDTRGVNVQVKFTRLFMIPCFITGFLSLVIVYITIKFRLPTLAVKFKDAGYGENAIFASFAIPTLITFFSRLLVYKLTARYRRSTIILCGYFIISTGMFLVGPSQILGFKDLIQLTFIGLCAIGLGCGMIFIPVLPEMIESVQEAYPGTDKDQLYNRISGIFVAAQALGEIAGPLLGHMFKIMYGFRKSQDIIAVTLLSFMILFYLVNVRNKKFQQALPESGEVNHQVLEANEVRVREPLLHINPRIN